MNTINFQFHCKKENSIEDVKQSAIEYAKAGIEFSGNKVPENMQVDFEVEDVSSIWGPHVKVTGAVQF